MIWSPQCATDLATLLEDRHAHNAELYQRERSLHITLPSANTFNARMDAYKACTSRLQSRSRELTVYVPELIVDNAYLDPQTSARISYGDWQLMSQEGLSTAMEVMTCVH